MWFDCHYRPTTTGPKTSTVLLHDARTTIWPCRPNSRICQAMHFTNCWLGCQSSQYHDRPQQQLEKPSLEVAPTTLFSNSGLLFSWTSVLVTCFSFNEFPLYDLELWPMQSLPLYTRPIDGSRWTSKSNMLKFICSTVIIEKNREDTRTHTITHNCPIALFGSQMAVLLDKVTEQWCIILTLVTHPERLSELSSLLVTSVFWSAIRTSHSSAGRWKSSATGATWAGRATAQPSISSNAWYGNIRCGVHCQQSILSPVVPHQTKTEFKTKNSRKTRHAVGSPDQV